MRTSPTRQARGSCRAMDNLPKFSARPDTHEIDGLGPGLARLRPQPADVARGQAQPGPWPGLVGEVGYFGRNH